MDGNQFTATGWYTLQEQALVSLTLLLALWNIACYALIPFVYVDLVGGL